jgi:hypothetical protein
MPGSALFIVENCRFSEAEGPPPEDLTEPARLPLLGKDPFTMFLMEVNAPMLLLVLQFNLTPQLPSSHPHHHRSNTEIAEFHILSILPDPSCGVRKSHDRNAGPVDLSGRPPEFPLKA